jgi:tetratricopeptide (TPR) repeat protein
MLYCRTLLYGFVYDDVPQIVRNPRVQSWHDFAGLFTHHLWAQQIAAAQGNYYRPLLLIWMRVNYSLFHLSPAGWHAALLLLHLAAGALVWFVTQALIDDNRGAALACALFLLHPLSVESAVWISDANDPLCLVFLLSSLLLLIKAGGKRRWVYLTLSIFLFALALLTKETALAFVPCVFLYCVLLRQHDSQHDSTARTWIHAGLLTLPFAIVAAAYFCLRRAVLGASLLHAKPAVTIGTTLLTLPSVLSSYAHHLLAPTQLSLFYDTPYVHSLGVHFWIPLIEILVVTVVAFVLAAPARTRVPAFGFGFAVLLLLPSLYGVAYFADLGLVHDRYIYPSLAGVAIFAGAVSARYLRSTAGIASAAALGFACCCLNLAQQPQWQNDFTLYRRAMQVAPSSPAPLLLMANLEFGKGNMAGGKWLLDESLSRNPNYVAGLLERGSLEVSMGLLPEAEQDAQAALSLRPDRADVHALAAQLRLRQGRDSEAVAEMNRAVELFPDNLQYRVDLARLYAQNSRLSEAIEQYRAALQVSPDDPGLKTAIAKLQQRNLLDIQKH